MNVTAINKATSLLYRYNHLLSEIIAQKNLFPSHDAFTVIYCKYAGRVNYLQGFLFRHS